ncbi:unnamed protein product, partial [Dicrocoelium dendriticum]
MSYHVRSFDQSVQSYWLCRTTLVARDRLKRHQNEPVNIFPQMLNSYVRSDVENAIQAWRPWCRSHIDALEAPQRKATKLVRGLLHLCYQCRLQSLKVYSGAYRRQRGDLIM